jgi:hypothetical protein
MVVVSLVSHVLPFGASSVTFISGNRVAAGGAGIAPGSVAATGDGTLSCGKPDKDGGIGNCGSGGAAAAVGGSSAGVALLASVSTTGGFSGGVAGGVWLPFATSIAGVGRAGNDAEGDAGADALGSAGNFGRVTAALPDAGTSGNEGNLGRLTVGLPDAGAGAGSSTEALGEDGI